MAHVMLTFSAWTQHARIISEAGGHRGSHSPWRSSAWARPCTSCGRRTTCWPSLRPAADAPPARVVFPARVSSAWYAPPGGGAKARPSHGVRSLPTFARSNLAFMSALVFALARAVALAFGPGFAFGFALAAGRGMGPRRLREGGETWRYQQVRAQKTISVRMYFLTG